jgi:hypothetical protein
MTTIQGDQPFSPEVVTWAKEWVSQDLDYLRQRARFAPEPIRSIAKLVLTAAGVEKEKEETQGRR